MIDTIATIADTITLVEWLGAEPRSHPALQDALANLRRAKATLQMHVNFDADE